MFICDKCGKQVEDLVCYTEYHHIGEGRPPITETHYYDECSCGGELQEATKCPICEEYFIADVKPCCDTCFEENLDKETCLLAGEKTYQTNDFFEFVFTTTEINEILEREFDKLDDYTKNKFIRDYATELSTQGDDRFVKAIIERKKYADLH